MTDRQTIDTSLRNTHDHTPPHSFGNCFSVCVAAIMGIPVEEVPHWYERGTELTREDLADIAQEQQSWLASRGWFYSGTVFRIDDWFHLRDTILRSNVQRDCPCIVTGSGSAENIGHCVVVMNEEVVLDPAEDGWALGGMQPMDDGCYVVEVLAPRPSHWRLP